MSDEQQMIRLEVLEEYRAILDDTAAMNSRRQNTNGLFVSINVVFLTALGFLLLSSHLDSWWTAAALVTVTFAILPLNISWIQAMSVYKILIGIRHKTLQKIERDFNFAGGSLPTISPTKDWENANHPSGNPHRRVFSGTLLCVGCLRHFDHLFCNESLSPTSKFLAPVNLYPQLHLPKAIAVSRAIAYILVEQAEMQPSKTKPG
jgi:hypothetical protein